MPQMSPMNWFGLFMFFNVSLYMTFSKIYFLSSLHMVENKVFMADKKVFSYKF